MITEVKVTVGHIEIKTEFSLVVMEQQLTMHVHGVKSKRIIDGKQISILVESIQSHFQDLYKK